MIIYNNLKFIFTKYKMNKLFWDLVLIVLGFWIILWFVSWLENHNKENHNKGVTQQENYSAPWNETTIKTINETSWDNINETKNENINKDVNQTSKTDDNILWKEEFEKLKKETKYFPEEMDYDTYVANIQYWNEKTNQAQLKILEERKQK